MPELSEFLPTPRDEIHTVRIARLAERQGGVIGSRQLRACGATASTASRWVRCGRLHPLHPGVYAVGHRVVELRARLFAALLYADPSAASLRTVSGAALSHQTAGWWWGLIDATPRRIHLTAPGQHRPLAAVAVHRARHRQVTRRNGLPVTTLARTLRDLAATLTFDELRMAVAEADHRKLLDPAKLLVQLGRGRAGSTALRRALEIHLPELAAAQSVLEQRFLTLVQAAGLPPPEANVYVAGFKVDAVWRGARVVVELDGHESHDRMAAAERDRERDLALRAAGYIVLRYTWQQVTRNTEGVIADLNAALKPSAAHAPN